jgi:mannose-1-phosphate guanylyltransferase
LKALLLAAGLGTRLRPLTDTIPKCLVPIRGKPLLEYWLDLLFGSGIDAAVINTHHLADRVRQFVAASRWKDRITLVHEDELLGTGGTVLRNRAYFEGQAFLVAHADNLTRFDVRAFCDRHALRPPGTVITMMTFVTEAPRSSGIVVEDSSGVVTEFHEKVASPPGNRANAAVYIFEPEVIPFLASLGRPVIDLSTEVLPQFLGRICSFHNATYHRDIGTHESLRKAELEYPWS